MHADEETWNGKDFHESLGPSRNYFFACHEHSLRRATRTFRNDCGSDIDALFARRLRELGLREGTTVHVAQNAAGGGRIVKVLDARYALDAFTLKHIAISTSS